VISLPRPFSVICTLLFLPLLLSAARFNPLAWHLPAEQACFLTSRVVALADTNDSFIGSGFFAFVDERPHWMYVVSNAHVVDGNKHLIAYNNGTSFDAYLLVEDREHDVAVLGIGVEDTSKLPQGVSTCGFIENFYDLWPGMLTVSSGYPLGLGWQDSGSAGLSFARVAQVDRADSLIRLDGVLDLGSSGAPVFTWIAEDKGQGLHLIGMARSFQVARTLSERTGDTLVIHSGLYEVIPAVFIDDALARADSLVRAYASSLIEEE